MERESGGDAFHSIGTPKDSISLVADDVTDDEGFSHGEDQEETNNAETTEKRGYVSCQK